MKRLFLLSALLSLPLFAGEISPRAANNLGLFVGTGSPPVSVVAFGGAWYLRPDIRLTIETGSSFGASSYGGSLDYLFFAGNPIAINVGMGLYHLSISDYDIFVQNKKNDSRNYMIAAYRIGLNFMTSWGLNLDLGAYLSSTKLFPTKSHDSESYPYFDIGYFW